MIDRDFRESIASLDASGVRYLVVGGYAVALHGHPRCTKDIDVWLEATPDNAARVIDALEAFGFASMGLTQADFLVPDQVIQLGCPPKRINLLTSLAGVDYGETYPARVQVDIDGLPVDFIDLENLKKNNRAAARAEDIADLENLS